MKLKNITDSDKELIDVTGKVILVGSKEIIELKKANYNPNAFKIVDEVSDENPITLNRKNRIKNVRGLDTNGTSK